MEYGETKTHLCLVLGQYIPSNVNLENVTKLKRKAYNENMSALDKYCSIITIVFRKYLLLSISTTTR